MEQLNFNIGANYAICMGPIWLDLHNDYDFEKYEYDPHANNALFSWSRSKSRSAEPGTAQKLMLRFDKLTLSKTEYMADSSLVADATTLAFLGFLHPDDLNVMDGCLTQDESDSTYHIIFRFENGLAIKCFSETVTCELDK